MLFGQTTGAVVGVEETAEDAVAEEETDLKLDNRLQDHLKLDQNIRGLSTQTCQLETGTGVICISNTVGAPSSVPNLLLVHGKIFSHQNHQTIEAPASSATLTNP